MKETLKASERPIGAVFDNSYVFTIPTYQRPYAWTTEQVGELLGDLEYAIDNGPDDLNEIAPYFLGSIVLIKDPAKPDAEVVDGQQRLTTITILLCVVRELAGEGAAAFIDPLIREEANPYTGTKARYRLSLRKRDREFFRENVQDTGALTAHSRRSSSTIVRSLGPICDGAFKKMPAIFTIICRRSRPSSGNG